MLNFGKLKNIFLGSHRGRLVLLAGFCTATNRQAAASERARSKRVWGGSTADLSQENLRRVAASAIQIRGVLVKDEGLMVE